jgi:hypothetical protein
MADPARNHEDKGQHGRRQLQPGAVEPVGETILSCHRVGAVAMLKGVTGAPVWRTRCRTRSRDKTVLSTVTVITPPTNVAVARRTPEMFWAFRSKLRAQASHALPPSRIRHLSRRRRASGSNPLGDPVHRFIADPAKVLVDDQCARVGIHRGPQNTRFCSYRVLDWSRADVFFLHRMPRANPTFAFF